MSEDRPNRRSRFAEPKSPEPIPVVDLFAGPGGLSEGFAAARGGDGRKLFDIRLAIEQDASAARTLKLRHVRRHLGLNHVGYHAVYRGDQSVEKLYEDSPIAATKADREVWQHSLSAKTADVIRDRVTDALGRAKDFVLVGGPPCQAYSLAGRSRNAGVESYVAEEDHRQTLYIDYLQVLADHAPAVFVMENVRGLASAKLYGQPIFSRFRDDLLDPSKAVRREGRVSQKEPTYELHSLSPFHSGRLFEDASSFLIKAERFGCPQSANGYENYLTSTNLPRWPDDAGLRRSCSQRSTCISARRSDANTQQTPMSSRWRQQSADLRTPLQ